MTASTAGEGKRAGLGRVLRLVAPEWRWLASGAGLGFLAVGSNVALMAMSAYLISRAAVVTNVAELALAITAVRVLAIGRAVFRYLERLVTHTATFRVLTDLRVWFYRAIEPLAPARLDTYRSGDLLARISADVDTLEDLSARVVVPPVVAVATAAFVAVLLGAFDPRLGGVVAAFLAAGGILVPWWSQRVSRGAAAAVVDERAALHATLVDGIGGLAELVAYGQAGTTWSEALAQGDAHDAAQARLARLRGSAAALIALATSLCAVSVLVIAIPLVTGGRLDSVYLALLPLAAIAAFEAIQPLPGAMQILDGSRAAADRLFELVDATPAVIDPPSGHVAGPDRAASPGSLTVVAPPPPPGPAAVDASRSRTMTTDQVARIEAHIGASLEVRDLRFAYGPGLPAVLEGLDLDIGPGERLAILGASGAGKSTLFDLLLRFWDYEHGSIRLAGVELRSRPADEARAFFGVVPQRIHLFDGTIRDNLALADADITDDQAWEALRMAQLEAVVRGLPDGLQARVGEDGVRLSDGERQRLAIARILVRGAPVVLLDEATSDLDAITEAELLESLEPFLAGRTVLMVTHRAAVAGRADRCVVLDAGRARPAEVKGRRA